jgi:lysophospholipase L1-like esterase
MKLPARPYSKFLSILALCTAALASGTAQVAEPLKSLLKNDVLVFDGDSITDGGRQRTGTDYNHIMGQDYAYILAGRIGYQYPERNLDFINRGVSSSLIGGMASRWQTDVLDLKPNILTILVGINDSMANGDDDASKYEAIYNKIIEDTLAALPNIKIILGEPFILPVGKHKDTYASDLAKVKLRQAAVERVAAKQHLPLIHFQKAMDDACRKAPPEHWSWDGIHPTYAGHALLAEEWIRAVNQRWP